MPKGRDNRQGQGRNNNPNKGGNKSKNQGQNIPEHIPSPYNFVPLSEKVFFPDWAKQVSMDVPFSDGISGIIEIEVEAKTPIYIRNGGDHPDDTSRLDDSDYNDFFRVHPGGQYAIPGTSFKGMLRNVVEIASFGKMSKVDDHRYAVRDLHNASLYTNRIRGVKAGWLLLDDNEKWVLEPCKFGRVEQIELEKMKSNVDLGKPQKSPEKYKQWKDDLTIKFDVDGEEDNEKCNNIGKGEKTGTLVFTGQSSQRGPKAKHLEFVFYGGNGEQQSVSPEIKKDFEFIHSVLRQKRVPNKEWEFWKEKLDRGKKVPVFYLMENKEVKSMGLAMMFRLPYKYSIKETVGHTGNGTHLKEAYDLSEVIFGHVEVGKDKKNVLRGRVTAGTLVAEGQPKVMEQVRTVLGGPKPTFYPNYIKQTGNNGYKTFMDNDAEVRGWKRYVTAKNDTVRQSLPGVSNEIDTAFRPLPAGTVFKGKLYLHNVREVELGAIVWAFDFGGDKNCRHALGMAKPYGYGSVTVKVTVSSLSYCSPTVKKAVNLQNCLNIYVNMMREEKPGWDASDQLLSLKVMAGINTNWPNEQKYPSLSPNEFISYKKVKKSLIKPPINEIRQKLEEEKQKADRLKKEADIKAEQERLENMTPDQIAEEKLLKMNEDNAGNLTGEFIKNNELTKEFFKKLLKKLDVLKIKPAKNRKWKTKFDEITKRAGK